MGKIEILALSAFNSTGQIKFLKSISLKMILLQVYYHLRFEFGEISSAASSKRNSMT